MLHIFLIPEALTYSAWWAGIAAQNCCFKSRWHYLQEAKGIFYVAIDAVHMSVGAVQCAALSWLNGIAVRQPL
jgi:hypothetical protein